MIDSPREYDQRTPGVCQHDLLKPDCTVTVRDNDPYTGSCWVCRRTWSTRHIILDQVVEDRFTGQQPAQPLDVSRLPMGDAHPIELVKAGCDPITGKPAQPESGEVKLYARRKLQALGSRFTAHMAAMTAEGLHSKSDIAAELAWRDWIIECERDVYERLHSELTAAQQRIRELESLNAERNRQNAAAFEERDELQRQIERYAWLVKHGESYFGSLWREATGADIDVGMAAGREQT